MGYKDLKEKKKKRFLLKETSIVLLENEKDSVNFQRAMKARSLEV